MDGVAQQGSIKADLKAEIDRIKHQPAGRRLQQPKPPAPDWGRLGAAVEGASKGLGKGGGHHGMGKGGQPKAPNGWAQWCEKNQHSTAQE